MKQNVTFLVWISIALAALGCSDRPVVGQRVAEADAQSTVAASSPVVARRVMANAEAVQMGGSPSPDGRTWVHTNGRSILIHDLATGRDRVVVSPAGVDHEVVLPTFSRDGSRIEYVHAVYGNFPAFTYAIRSIGLDGSGEKTLFENKSEGPDLWLPARWSADGAYIATLLDRSPGSNRIGIVSTRDRRTWVLKSFDWREPHNVSFSPDGHFLAYDFPPDETSASRDVFIIATDGSRESRVATDVANERFLGWTPDGNILFSSDRDGTPSIYASRIVDGRAQGAPQLVKRDLFRISLSFGVTQNGSLFYLVQPTARDVFTMTVDPATLKVVVPPAPISSSGVGQNEYPNWSPDGRFVAYVSYPVPRRSGGQQIVIRPVDAGEVRTLTPELSYFERLKWMPDGRTFIVSGEDAQNRGGLFRIDAQTGVVTPVRRVDPDRGVRAAQSFALSHDGQTLFLTVRLPRSPGDGPAVDSWSFVAFDLKSGTEREIRRFSGLTSLGSLVTAPDGTQSVFAAADASGQWRLFTMPAGGGEPKEVYRAPDGQAIGPGALNWMSDRRVFFLTREKAPIAANPAAQRPGTERLLSAHLDGGAAITSDFEVPENVGAFRLHPDGRRFVFERGLPSYEIWALEHATLVAGASR